MEHRLRLEIRAGLFIRRRVVGWSLRTLPRSPLAPALPLGRDRSRLGWTADAGGPPSRENRPSHPRQVGGPLGQTWHGEKTSRGDSQTLRDSPSTPAPLREADMIEVGPTCLDDCGLSRRAPLTPLRFLQGGGREIGAQVGRRPAIPTTLLRVPH